MKRICVQANTHGIARKSFMSCVFLRLVGLEPTIEMIKLSKKVLIANKESVICGWNIIKKTAKKNNTIIIPVDSEHFSILELIKNKYGEKYVNHRSYKSKSKGAQEAHEAIRPTNFSKLTIDGDYDQKRLYELIWRRTVSSQMTDSQIERTNLKITKE